MFSDLHLSPQRQARIYATGLLTLLTLGSLALIAFCFLALWLVAQIANLALQSLIELASTWSAIDPILKLFLLICASYLLYRAVKRWRSAHEQ